LHITENNKNNIDNYDFPLQISPSIRSKQISSVIADLQSKNENLSNQLSTFREKFINEDYLNNEAINGRKEKNKSKSSQKSFGIPSFSHDKKKSFDNTSNKSSRNESLIRNTHKYNNNNFNNNAYFESSDKKIINEKSSKNFYLPKDKTTSNFYKINSNKSKCSSNNSNSKNNSNKDKEYFNYLKDEANYYIKDCTNNINNINIKDYISNEESPEKSSKHKRDKSASPAFSSKNINININNQINKISAIPNNFIYESMKIRSTKHLNVIVNNNTNTNTSSNKKNDNNNKNNFDEKLNSIKNLNSNPEMLSSWNAFNNSGGISKSPLKRLQDIVAEKEREISALEQKLQQANMSEIANEKSTCKAERKVESLQKIISEILSKNKADQGTIEKLKEEVNKLCKDGEVNSGYNNRNRIFKKFNKKTEEILIHKIYSNFKDVDSDYTDNNENVSKKYNLQNSFYFVLISDAVQQNFLWVDLINQLNVNNCDSNNNSKSPNKAFMIENEEHKIEEEQRRILDAINHFNELTKKYKNSNNNNNDSNNKNTIINNKKTSNSNKNTINSNNNTISNEDSSKSNKSKQQKHNAEKQLDTISKPEKYKNFTAIKLPLQNLHSIESEMLNVYSDYLSFERELNNSKNFFIDEINRKEAIIQTLRVDLERLLEDNSDFIKSDNVLKSEIAEKDKMIINFDLLNKEKDLLLSELSSELEDLKEKFAKSLENRKALEARISELQAIVIGNENNFGKEKQSFEARVAEYTHKLDEAAKSLGEKDLLIEKFTNKLDELEAKYRSNFQKIEFIEKSELNNNNNKINNSNNNKNSSTEERASLLGKIHELELMKNSYLDKISILEYINKNFENEKADKEKHFDELSLKATDLQKQLETSHSENKANLEKLAEKESAMQKTLAELSALISNKNKEITSINKLNEEIEKTLKANLEEISSLSKTLEIRSKNASNCEKEIKELKKELKDAKFNYEDKSQNLAAANKKIVDLENQIRFNFDKFDEEKNRLRDEMNTKLNNMLMEKSENLTKYQSLLDEFNKYQQNCEKLKNQNEENLKKLKLENKKLKNDLNKLISQSQIENKELEEMLIEFNIQVENSVKMQKEFSDAESKLTKLDAVLLKQEEIISKLTFEKEEIEKKMEEEKNKNSNIMSKINSNNYYINKENSNSNSNNHNSIICSSNDSLKLNNNEAINIEHLNTRILEIQKINIQLDDELKEKAGKIEVLENEKLFANKKLSEAKEANERNIALINEKHKKLIISDEFAIKDLSRKLRDIEIDLKNTEDENLLYKNQIIEMQKNINFLIENQPNNDINNTNINNKNTYNHNKSLEYYEKHTAQLESEIRVLSDENFKLKEELENARNQFERLVDELNENNILKLDPNMTKRADEVNVTLYGNNNIYNTNLNNSQLNNSTFILDLNNTTNNNNNNINVISTNALTNSTANNNYKNNNNDINNNNILINSSGKDKEKNNEYMLKILDYEDKLEKLIFSNSELARKNNSLTIEIKTLQERIYALENFEEPEINKKLKKMNSSHNLQKDSLSIQIENERLQELIKDYEQSISELQNKLELQCNEINRIREEYDDENCNMKKKEVENFSFFANEKTERNNFTNNFNNNKNFVASNNLNNMTFFDSISIHNENDFRNSNIRVSNEDCFRKLNAEISEKNKLIEKLSKELNDSYALMGEANKKLEIFEVDYLNKSK